MDAGLWRVPIKTVETVVGRVVGGVRRETTDGPPVPEGVALVGPVEVEGVGTQARLPHAQEDVRAVARPDQANDLPNDALDRRLGPVVLPRRRGRTGARASRPEDVGAMVTIAHTEGQVADPARHPVTSGVVDAGLGGSPPEAVLGPHEAVALVARDVGDALTRERPDAGTPRPEGHAPNATPRRPATVPVPSTGVAGRGRRPRPRDVHTTRRGLVLRPTVPVPLGVARLVHEVPPDATMAKVAVRNGGAPTLAVRDDVVAPEAVTPTAPVPLASTVDAVAGAGTMVPRPRIRVEARVLDIALVLAQD